MHGTISLLDPMKVHIREWKSTFRGGGGAGCAGARAGASSPTRAPSLPLLHVCVAYLQLSGALTSEDGAGARAGGGAGGEVGGGG